MSIPAQLDRAPSMGNDAGTDGPDPEVEAGAGVDFIGASVSASHVAAVGTAANIGETGAGAVLAPEIGYFSHVAAVAERTAANLGAEVKLNPADVESTLEALKCISNLDVTDVGLNPLEGLSGPVCGIGGAQLGAVVSV